MTDLTVDTDIIVRITTVGTAVMLVIMYFETAVIVLPVPS